MSAKPLAAPAEAAAHDHAASAPPRHLPCGGGAGAVLILLLTLALSLLWSHTRLMWNDEFLSFYSDSVSTLAGVLHVQWHTPISLDPPAYHLLSHLAMDVFGRNATALRLPATFGFLLLELCLFLLVRQLAGRRAALVAMALPLSTASFRYAVEGRPYGLLLGLYAASLLCWHTAAQRGERSEARTFPLLSLFLSIALAIASHYFGMLILLPVGAAEAVRSLQRRRMDWPVAGALLAGMASIALILPGKAALAPYQRHYYTGAVNLHNVSQGYREIFLRYTAWPVPLQRVAAMLLAAGTVALAIAAVRCFRNRPPEEPAARWSALWTALLVLAVLPFFGYLFGRFVTHTMEVRYVIAALIPFVVIVALLLERPLRSARFFYTALGTVLVFATVVIMDQVRAERLRSDAILAGMGIPQSLHAKLESHPAERLYTQSLGDFFLDGYYGADPLLRDRITLLYDEPLEVHWLHHNTNAVTAENLQAFSALRTVPYAPVLQRGNALLLDYHSGWEWVGNDLRTRPVTVEPMGNAAGATLLRLAPFPALVPVPFPAPVPAPPTALPPSSPAPLPPGDQR